MESIQNFLTDALLKFSEYSRAFGGSGFSFSNFSYDVLIVLFLLVAAFLYGVSLGRNRVIVILIGVYMALALVNFFPYMDRLIEEFNVGGAFAIRITTFVAFILILFFLLSHSALRSVFNYPTKDDSSWFQILVFSILTVGLVISVIVSYLPDDFLDRLSPLTLQIFGTQALFWWILLPILAMSMIRRKKRGGH